MSRTRRRRKADRRGFFTGWPYLKEIQAGKTAFQYGQSKHCLRDPFSLLVTIVCFPISLSHFPPALSSHFTNIGWRLFFSHLQTWMSAQILWRNLAVITVIIILEVTSVPAHQSISSMRIWKHVEVRDLHERWPTARVSLGQVRYCTWKTFSISLFNQSWQIYFKEKYIPVQIWTGGRLCEFLLTYS